MNKKTKAVRQFKSEAAERKFWEAHDSAVMQSEIAKWGKVIRAVRIQPS